MNTDKVPDTKLKGIKLIVADLDGTLLKSDKSLDDNIIDVISGQDYKFTIASGRSMILVKKFISELNIDLPYITNNGAEIYQSDACVKQYSIPDDEVRFILNLVQEFDLECHANAENCIYTMGKIDLILPFRKRFEGVLSIVDNASVNSVCANTINKIMCIDKDLNKVQEFANKINLYCEHVHCERAEGNAFVIVNRQASKGKVLKNLIELLHISTEEVIVFGDNYNDVSMFEAVKYSVCMENADKDVKDKATFICKSNDMNGVSDFIQKYINPGWR
ncbi:HAD family hydrolase [Holdemanella porci]|uniref:HAD family hydrolase n=1 Tax=Holdemanella porci TaxID=2652276 RepID=UPI002942838F|nr:HAD family hydrolase [Holdemanella porci]